MTETTMHLFQNKPLGELERSPDTKERLEAFAQVLNQIKGEMEALRSRALPNRIFSHEEDASKLRAMKERVDDAIKSLQLETIVAAGHGIDVIRQDLGVVHQDLDVIHQDLGVMSREQRSANQKQDERDRILAQQLTRQQLLTSWQQYMSSPEPHDAGLNFFFFNVKFVSLTWILLRSRKRYPRQHARRCKHGAAKKPPCLVGTRKPILGRITKWIEGGSSSKHGFLLLGQAGTGKSSIASSIAVFHFTRDEQARNEGAILMLARQLANWGEGRLRLQIASAVKSIVREGLDIAQMTPTDQFTQLIQEPLETLDATSPVLVIILDALPAKDGLVCFTTAMGWNLVVQCGQQS
ncbi:hypothetical protein FRB94_003669 [Tulasnella sp. JGI-2019a]|nr:hypothetical protein FRB93_011354 [Tulasnella sp. JGI-2019a]KAG9002749.1 hypothetical protein FRB94_003669 [Tulasnella sp. JGI-2019a]KAG9022811.1 hypothetical protein FRB95_014130 [Tulasnella sp. JGI-2019a]